jgi:hypothetical protein
VSDLDELNNIAMGATFGSDDHRLATEEQMDRARWRLMKFLIYDFVIFLICVGLGVFLALKNFLDDDAQLNKGSANQAFQNVNSKQGGNWKFKSGLYWLKAFYGLMSFPFVLLLIPGISTLLSHARPTGYNRWGNCVPYLGHEEEEPTHWRPYAIDKRTGKRREAFFSRAPVP